jgi:hypothetical protein
MSGLTNRREGELTMNTIVRRCDVRPVTTGATIVGGFR